MGQATAGPMLSIAVRRSDIGLLTVALVGGGRGRQPAGNPKTAHLRPSALAFHPALHDGLPIGVSLCSGVAVFKSPQLGRNMRAWSCPPCCGFRSDAGHVPFTHHGTVSKRQSSGLYQDMRITERGPWGFKGVWPTGRRATPYESRSSRAWNLSDSHPAVG